MEETFATKWLDMINLCSMELRISKVAENWPVVINIQFIADTISLHYNSPFHGTWNPYWADTVCIYSLNATASCVLAVKY